MRGSATPARKGRRIHSLSRQAEHSFVSPTGETTPKKRIAGGATCKSPAIGFSVPKVRNQWASPRFFAASNACRQRRRVHPTAAGHVPRPRTWVRGRRPSAAAGRRSKPQEHHTGCRHRTNMRTLAYAARTRPAATLHPTPANRPQIPEPYISKCGVFSTGRRPNRGLRTNRNHPLRCPARYARGYPVTNCSDDPGAPPPARAGSGHRANRPPGHPMGLRSPFHTVSCGLLSLCKDNVASLFKNCGARLGYFAQPVRKPRPPPLLTG